MVVPVVRKGSSSSCRRTKKQSERQRTGILRAGEEWKTERIGYLILVSLLILIAAFGPLNLYICGLVSLLSSIFIVGICKFFGGTGK